MALIPKLKSTIGRNYGVEEDDTLTMKNILKRLGHYKTPDYGMTPFPDEPLFDGIRKFQKAKGLLVDGVVAPQGPTARALGKALSPTVPRRAKLAAKAAASGRPLPDALFRVLRAALEWRSLRGLLQARLHARVRRPSHRDPAQDISTHPASDAMRLLFILESGWEH